MHTGKGNRSGRFDRADFERFGEKFGPELLEFSFLRSVFDSGLCFFNLLQVAELFVRWAKKLGVTPSFQLGSPTDEEHIERCTPGFAPDEDGPSHRVWRLRRRRRYSGLSQFLDIIHCSDQTTADVMAQHESFDAFVSHLKVNIHPVKKIDSMENYNLSRVVSFCDDHTTVIKNGRARSGSIGKRFDGGLVCDRECLPILRDQYDEFRHVLISDSPL